MEARGRITLALGCALLAAGASAGLVWAKEGLAQRSLSRRAALLAPMLRPQSRPYLPDMCAPCVLASERASHPGDEDYSAKPSYY